MTNPESKSNIPSLSNLVSSSNSIEAFQNKNSLQNNGSNVNDDLPEQQMKSFGDLSQVEEDTKGKLDTAIRTPIGLHRSTSFEELLMEHHRTVLVDSIRDYFQKVEHRILKCEDSIKQFSVKTNKTSAQTFEKQPFELIQNILSSNSFINQTTSSKILTNLKQNPDQLQLLYQMLNICPRKIEFQVLFLISFLFEDCHHIIQHFQSKKLTFELKDKSIKHATKLRQMGCLKYLFEAFKEEQIPAQFQILVQKWLITLFLVKVGVFQNDLEIKSVDECLKSQVFSQIDVTDLIHQHLIYPLKKKSKKQQ